MSRVRLVSLPPALFSLVSEAVFEEGTGRKTLGGVVENDHDQINEGLVSLVLNLKQQVEALIAWLVHT